MAGYQEPTELSGVFWFSTVTAFLLAFTIGANDVANNFGTSVGSGAVSMRTAILVAGVAEILGAVTLGSGVSDTIVRGISDLDSAQCWDCGGPSGRITLFMLGMACALAAGALFLLAATWAGMPVSTTHAIVGAVIGMTLVGTSAKCVLWGWPGLAAIAASWVLSPVCAGALSAAVLLFVRRRLLGAADPTEATLAATPFLGAGTVAMMAALLLLKSSATKSWPFWLVILATAGAFAGVALLARLWAVPYLRRVCLRAELFGIQLTEHAGKRAGGGCPDRQQRSAEVTVDTAGPAARSAHDSGNNSACDVSDLSLQHRSLELSATLSDAAADAHGDGGGDEDEDGLLDEGAPMSCDIGLGAEPPDVPRKADLHDSAERVFMYLQIMTACLKSYAHGANDTANAAGPYTAIQALYIHGADDCTHVVTPFWVLAAGGLGIVLGLACLGHKVMATIGSGLTAINFSRGFCIELGSTVAVVFASVVGMPVSSTHCQVMACP
eukprot:jgi/Tetstr1/465961/TSEL_000924.t1